jgi:hypothetical protein
MSTTRPDNGPLFLRGYATTGCARWRGLEQRSPDSTMILKFSEIKNNAAIEDAAFAKPAK